MMQVLMQWDTYFRCYHAVLHQTCQTIDSIESMVRPALVVEITPILSTEFYVRLSLASILLVSTTTISHVCSLSSSRKFRRTLIELLSESA